MAGTKVTHEIVLNEDHMSFIRNMKDQYNLADESKAFRVIVDYLITNPDAHATVFDERRCLRCE